MKGNLRGVAMPDRHSQFEFSVLFRNKLLLPVIIMLLTACYLHLFWFPGIYSTVQENSAHNETDYLDIISKQIRTPLELGNHAQVTRTLNEVLRQRPAWQSISIEGLLDGNIAVKRTDSSVSVAQQAVSLPLELQDGTILTLTAEIDFSNLRISDLRTLRIFELILVICIVLAALAGYYSHENSIRKQLFALSRHAEALMQSVSTTIQPTRQVSEVGKLSEALNFLLVELQKCRSLIEFRHRILETIRQGQLNFIRDISPEDIFYNILGNLLDITDSEFGYIGEVLYEPSGTPYLRIFAARSNNSCIADFMKPGDGRVTADRHTLSGLVITNAQIVNTCSETDKTTLTGLDSNLPLPETYLGIPFMRGEKVIGMFCLANRNDNYNPELVELLLPVASTCTSLVEATKNERERQRVAAELEDKVEHIKAIVDTVIDGIITINEKGVIESFNPAAESIFGYAADEVIGNNISMLMPEPYRSAHNSYIEAYCMTGDKKIIGIGREVEGLRKDGSTFPMDLAVSEMYAGNDRMFTGVVRDITERKAADRIKNEFISVVSHELRTPLTSIHGSLRLIESGMAGRISRNCTELVNLANKNVRRLIRLINDLLDIEKMEAGKYSYNLEHTDMHGVIEYALRECAAYAREKDIQFIHDRPQENVMVNIDRDRIVQVMVNLLSNAVKFSPAGNTVTVSVEKTSDRIRTLVTDNGQGIPDEFRDRVFSKFCQADSSDSRKLGGTGLGLSICKTILDGHGGSISFSSEPGLGTTFYFDLPAANQESGGITGIDARQEDRLRVLVCDADDTVSEECIFQLQNAGFAVDHAADAGSTTHSLVKQHYDALVMTLTGVETATVLRDPVLRASGIPVIVLGEQARFGNSTSTGMPETVFRYLDAQVDGHTLLDTLVLAIQHRDSKPRRILHVEDDPDIVALVRTLLDDTWDVIPAGSLSEARDLLPCYEYDLVILDIGLPDGSGLDLLPEIRNHGYPVVLFTEEDSSEGTMFRFDARLVKSFTSSATLLRTVLDLTDAA